MITEQKARERQTEALERISRHLENMERALAVIMFLLAGTYITYLLTTYASP